jgi:hypothetical protein
VVTPEAKAALEAEVRRLEAEEAASATPAERRAAETLNATAPGAAPATAAAAPSAAALTATLAALPPEVITPLVVLALDRVVRAGAAWLGDEQSAQRYACTAEERQFLVDAWLPAVRHYSQLVTVHPLALGLMGTAVVYGTKALPPGGLEAVLQGGDGGQPAPAAVSPAALVNAPKPSGDAVLELVRQQAAELETMRSKKESVAA